MPVRKLIFSENPYCRAWLYRASLSIQALFFPAAASNNDNNFVTIQPILPWPTRLGLMHLHEIR
ncbi:MAG: hypothetical protein KZQ63_06790, partial [Candidatus Thiodiazotropha sp. (ex Lucinoma aequizonata)]|nr:hypothetical protein [Candidatus Thiodiazotropha sp. (ex Lucinoma aequizonata)]